MNLREYWKEVSLDGNDPCHPILPMIASLLLGVGVLSQTSSLPAAGCISALGIKLSMERAYKAAKQFDSIWEDEFLSVSLNQDQLAEYISDYGLEFTLAELRQAKAKQILLSEAAEKLLKEGSIEIIEKMPVPTGAIIAPVQQANHSNQTIYLPTSQRTWTLDQLVTETDNRLILGLKGSGKTVVVSEMIKLVRSKFPTKRVFVIDPKADPNEIDLYSFASEVYRGNIGEMSPTDALEFIEEGYERYINHSEPGLLVIDECIMVGGAMSDNRSNYLESKLRYIIAGGDSRNLNVWLIAQSPMLKDLGLTTGVASQLNKTIIATIESLPNIRAWGNGVLMKGVEVDDAIPCIKSSPIPKGRAIYCGGWYSMPLIETKYNRDERKLNAALSQQETPQDCRVDGENSENAANSDVSTHSNATHSNAKHDQNLYTPTTAVNAQATLEIDDLILDYFAAVKLPQPKSLRDIKYSSRVRSSDASDLAIQSALDRLVLSGSLIECGGLWSFPDWTLTQTDAN
jgi:hypothetical protein